MKHLLKIISIILIIVVLGFAYYYFFFNKKPGPSAPVNTSTPTNYFPFGEGGTATSSSTADTNAVLNTTPSVGDYLSRLRLISNDPVAGATFVTFASATTSGDFIRYMQKGTGHIFDVSVSSNEVDQISNTTIPKVYQAYFTANGTGVIGRYLADDNQTIKTFYATVASTTIGVFLPDNIAFVSISPSGKSIFYIIASSAGSKGILGNANGSKGSEIWDSPLSEVLPQFSGSDIILTTKPSLGSFSFAYLINGATGSKKHILSNITDLSVLADTSSKNILIYTADGGGKFFVEPIAGNTSTTLSPTTFPEKCVFDSNNVGVAYCAVPQNGVIAGNLDQWYLGTISFSDNIWKYDLTNGTATMIENLQNDAGRPIDAENLELNSASSLLMFHSKTDGSLWTLNVGA